MMAGNGRGLLVSRFQFPARNAVTLMNDTGSTIIDPHGHCAPRWRAGYSSPVGRSGDFR